ncbi:hypothetical protein AOLI_G00018550 [Acnodon oligacanthus]
MATDEDDYMSDAFLNQLVDIRPGMPMVKRAKDTLRREALHKQKSIQNKQKSYKQHERDSRDAALQSSLSNENKGFALLQKMGYKAGQGLGKEGSGQVEPIPLNIKTDRGGIGMEQLKKRKAEEKLESFRKKVQVKQLMEKKSLEDFRDRKKTEREKRRTEGDLRKSQRACEHLDSQKGINIPKDSWYWPDVISDEAEHIEQESSTEGNEDEDEEELTPLDKLQYVTSYLRGVHFYCIWCGTAYNDEVDLSSNCPGHVSITPFMRWIRLVFWILLCCRWSRYWDSFVFSAMATNYVGSLNEYAQKNNLTVDFEVVDTRGPDHIKTFTIRAVVNGETYSNGVGRNKKEAKQNAAKNALCLLEKTEPANSETNDCSSDSFPNLTPANYTCWLNEYAQKNRSIFKPIETTRMGSNTQFRLYACKYISDVKEFPEAVCKGRKDAKEAAAKNVYEELLKESKIIVPDENRNVAQNSNMPPLSSPLSSQTASDTESVTVRKNFIGMLNHYCQKTNQVLDNKLVDKRGPAHNPEFVYKVVINKTEYPEGQGKTAKEAKQNAAQLALSVLREQSDWNSQSSFMSSVSEDESPSQISVNESKDDESSLKAKSQSTSDSVFKNSSVPMTNTNSPAPKPSPSDVKPKIKLAANFQVSPNRNEEETPSMNDPSLTQPSTKGTTASNSSAKSRFLEDFESISPIGTGGFGYVFKARKKLEKKYYAVKIVKRTSKSVREVEALADLSHPNIVRYYTSWTEETTFRSESSDSFSISNSSSGSASEYLYIQMEFCEGETLRKWIGGRNSHPEKHPERRQDALQIMKQALEAVKYIHSKCIIHRDLKPANIMFGNERAVKIGDFGLATAAEGDNDGSLLERTKRTGTHSYMSPEQRSQCSYDKKVDIFALGLIYFELLWRLGTECEKQKIWDNIRSKKLPKGFSEKFEFEHKLIKQMLCENPKDRPDASELLTKLDRSSAVIHRDHNGNRENRTY